MIYGMDKQIRIFDEIIRNNRFVNGYIFHGISGIGKKMFAFEVARVTLCEKKSKFNDDCDCHSCNLVRNNAHPDLIEVLPYKDEKSVGIDNIREISESVYMSSYMGGYKFYIIDNFHELSIPACNAFLKTLEEPGENVVFFLITDQINKILPTIRSRCIQLKFNRLKNEDISSILSNHGFNVEESDIAVEFSGGSAAMAIKYIESGLKEGSFIKNLSVRNATFGDLTEHIINILKITEKDDLRYHIMFLIRKALDVYKLAGDYKYLVFISHLLDCYRMLDYNINIRILRANIMTKIYGVMSEKI